MRPVFCIEYASFVLRSVFACDHSGLELCEYEISLCQLRHCALEMHYVCVETIETERGKEQDT
jgi:hypothetical protein